MVKEITTIVDGPISAEVISLDHEGMECAEVNGPVSLCGCLVMPGDLIVADGSGVCIVPNELVEEVLEKAEKSAAKEEEFSRILEAGGGIEELKKAK